MRFASFTLLVVLVAACGDDDNKACDPQANSGCDDGKVCEVVTGGAPACFAPLTLRGQVFDLETGDAIDGARVVALDVNGAPASSVEVTADGGKYALRIPTERAADGTPVGQNLTLRVDAARYQSFPSGIRQPLPIDTTAAVNGDGGYAVESALTKVGLIALANAGTGSLSGKVEVAPNPRGTLVVAETANTPGSGFSAIADNDGSYTIFNLPAGNFTVRAYAIGSNYTPGMITLTDGQAGTLDLKLDAATASKVSGQVDLVEGATPTSVILVVASTFNETLARGETPPGLRAPAPGVAPNIDGPFTIEGVPAGRYVALAAFENDGSVRDQSGIGGTSLLFIDVTAGQDFTFSGSFKVTVAIPLNAPGANGAEMVSAAPTIAWTKDPSAKDYLVQVFDSFGNTVMEQHTNSGATTSLPYTGPLEPGMYYQARVTSFDDAAPTPHALSNTEDLKGVFFTAP